MRVIITGATGFVGGGVLAECLRSPVVTGVLVVDRRPNVRHDAKLKQLVVLDFMDLSAVLGELVGYDACFYCAGVTSVGVTEAEYTKVTLDTALYFADTVAKLNPDMVLCHVSGKSAVTDARSSVRSLVAERAEEELAKLPFRSVYALRPVVIEPDRGAGASAGSRGVAAGATCSVAEVGRAMLRCVGRGEHRSVLEAGDIVEAARG